ncbi:GTPase ObgE [Sporolactobacillus inulinus]|uniref:GTPase Obg n=1 Tax=Sporolactobacillus inulinus CASD TaxID=1069536 RepID=A0A0U1QRE4_9BACL|nr:GTPase ObgE [Sporolactobacillus inulinus]KLI03387.1 GTPase ObgE [Sporolactobacillus inulinus CASD]GEB76357.1 GTPase Obg [Sporolactobacillus inulinus]
MFVDQVNVFVKGGDGGNGMVAFRREKYVPDGGPAGGDGGKGADVIFEVNEGLRTLMDFRYKRHFKGKKGENGRTKNQHGKSAAPLVVQIPPGTVVKDRQTGQVLADLTENGQRQVIAAGGRGGRGNTRFSTPANPAPYISENGEPGEEREVQLELKLLADAGLVGFPSVGKSTLLSVVTSAKPKIAEYHFTTLAPNLGVVAVDEGRSFVLADLPGLIEGASSGAGLGYQFLRHIERTRVIIHVVDMSGSEGRDPYEDYQKINEELKSYQLRLLERPQVIAASKMDMPEAEGNLKAFREKVDPDVPIFAISSLTKAGLKELTQAVYQLILTTPEFPMEKPVQEDGKGLYTFEKEEAPFVITRDSDGVFNVSGPKVELLFKMTNFNHDEAIRRFARQLRGMGVDDALREKGVSEGDTVRIMDFEFEYSD